MPASVLIDAEGRRSLVSHPRDERGRRVVSVHATGEWVISAPGVESAVLSLLSTADLVLVAQEPIDFYAARKRWLVGGVHLVLALVARREAVDLLPLDHAYETAFVERVTPLMEQATKGLGARWPDMKVEPAYAEKRIAAFLETPDTTARIIERHLIRADLRGLMARINARVGDAARAARSAGEDCEPFFDVMALVVTLLRSRTSYYDDVMAPLDPAIDEQAIELFAAALADWLEDDRSNDLIATLRRALTAHRALNA